MQQRILQRLLPGGRRGVGGQLFSMRCVSLVRDTGNCVVLRKLGDAALRRRFALKTLALAKKQRGPSGINDEATSADPVDPGDIPKEAGVEG